MRSFRLMIMVSSLLATTACDRTNPCPYGMYVETPRRACILPDGGRLLLDDAGASPDAGAPTDAAAASDGCVAQTLYRDQDGDGRGDPGASQTRCPAPGWVEDSTDCNDSCDTCWTGAIETCDGLDNDCDPSTADGSAATCPVGPMVAASECIAGTCEVRTCVGDWLDCDGDPTNGCEVELGTVEACGGCGDVCGWICEAGSCNDPLALDVGSDHACVLGDRGEIWCWGQNGDHQLGRARTSSPYRAAMIPSLAGATAFAAGSQYTLVLGSSLLAWGGNGRGVFGDGTRTSTTTAAAPASSLIALIGELAAGARHACARRADGTERSVQCWGENEQGQVGDGTVIDRLTPTQVDVSLVNVEELAAAYDFTCARRTDGSVWCWGSNQFGNLGDGSTTSRTRPVRVEGVTGATAVAAGGGHACAIATSGAVWCWGDNFYGQVGDGTTSDRLLPVEVVGLTSRATALGLGASHSCAILEGGAVACWGHNGDGQLGVGSTEHSTSPLLVTGLPPVRTIDGGNHHTCALSDTRTPILLG